MHARETAYKIARRIHHVVMRNNLPSSTQLVRSLSTAWPGHGKTTWLSTTPTYIYARSSFADQHLGPECLLYQTCTKEV